ncbi:hypothetical protein E2C01_033893 [Portunus trituberculatus]|uniref:Uncharacterized protein n=1 Tax=Portunus trituberculatus TaxID=210409 RepID=A0A5B7F459_PORTR|nr:hypothetical protein [Portunus trituberculatus]
MYLLVRLHETKQSVLPPWMARMCYQGSNSCGRFSEAACPRSLDVTHVLSGRVQFLRIRFSEAACPCYLDGTHVLSGRVHFLRGRFSEAACPRYLDGTHVFSGRVQFVRGRCSETVGVFQCKSQFPAAGPHASAVCVLF